MEGHAGSPQRWGNKILVNFRGGHWMQLWVWKPCSSIFCLPSVPPLSFSPFIPLFSFSLLSSCHPPPAAGYGDSVYRVYGYMCLDSSSQSQADTFKLVFDEQPNSRVRELCVCVCVIYLIWCHAHTCLLCFTGPHLSVTFLQWQRLIFWKFKVAFVRAKWSSHFLSRQQENSDVWRSSRMLYIHIHSLSWAVDRDQYLIIDLEGL